MQCSSVFSAVFSAVLQCCSAAQCSAALCSAAVLKCCSAAGFHWPEASLPIAG